MPATRASASTRGNTDLAREFEFRFVHEHYIFSPGQETYSYYGPLNHVTFDAGYHNEHHDFMSVSGWRLPELRAKLDPYYRDLVGHDSWTAVLVRYVLDRNIGPHSRIVRDRRAFTQQRRDRATRRGLEPNASERELAPSANAARNVALAG